MKIKHFFILLLFLSLNIQAQERRIPRIPDIPGYQTLLCDFHMHTVFSDGLVWPTVRVNEAWQQGLDAIAITDHLEYLPHKTDIRTDYNRSWQIAKEYASNKDVIVISGTEITKGMPPGHLNALFIKDATPILNDDFNKAIEEAANQGAFIMWNHPGWKAQQPDTMKWWDEHSYLLKKGWLHGIEVTNYNEYYPEAINWARDSGLTMIGSSDMHEPFLEKDLFSKNHRYITLVFATEKSEGGIRDALFNGRTAAYIENKVIGKPSLLEALFIQSIQISKDDINTNVLTISNISDIHFDLLFEDKIYQDWSKQITVKPGYETILKIPVDTKMENVVLSVKNFITGADDVLTFPLNDLKSVHK
ncbi:MAG: PHP domain-containing protein [Bacteroidales bacterium]|jgi:predicted metal-dependent phosphoesterase TrpH|nr:PHP domain-containing protein [Bacteroidales bacterium]